MGDCRTAVPLDLYLLIHFAYNAESVIGVVSHVDVISDVNAAVYRVKVGDILFGLNYFAVIYAEVKHSAEAGVVCYI